MSFIQDIREKYARWAVVAIALSLLGFILMDAFAGRGSLFNGGPSSSLGRVNGNKIDVTEFNKRVQQQESYMMQQMQSGSVSERDRRNIMDRVWNDMVSQVLLQDELDKLGMKVGKKEVNDILFGANPPEDLKRQFTDPQTGLYDAVTAQQQINEIKRRGTAEQKARFSEYISQLEFQRLFDKYNSLLANSVNSPRWYLEKQNADKSLIANISYVKVNYADSMFVDSTIKISDKEIEEYISKHKDAYKQQEETRSIDYVLFSARASSADSQLVRQKLLDLKPEFDTTDNIQKFFNREGSRTPYNDSYQNKDAIQSAYKDSILNIPVGSIYGPYLEGQNYVLAKKVGAKQWPDSVKVRHILIGLTQQDPQSGEMIPIRDTATAKKLADSIELAIKNGSKFESLVSLSDDNPEAENPEYGKYKGGIYDRVKQGQMVPEFNNFIFDNNTGSKGVVKTQFGYHYVEVLSQKGSTPVYKFAYLSKPIIATQETDNIANNAANQFAGKSRDQKSFQENYEKELRPKQINKLVGTDIKKNDYSVGGLVSREFVRNIYDAKRGDVLQPMRIGEDYVVAVVTEINKKGSASIANARMTVEPILRNRKKAEIVKQKIGNISTLEAASSAVGKQIETADSLRLVGPSPALGFEPKVLGAIFNSANLGKVIPRAIEGVNGVYVIKVETVSATAVEDANVDEQRRSNYQSARQAAMYRFADVLRSAASIKDNRAKHF